MLVVLLVAEEASSLGSHSLVTSAAEKYGCACTDDAGTSAGSCSGGATVGNQGEDGDCNGRLAAAAACPRKLDKASFPDPFIKKRAAARSKAVPVAPQSAMMDTIVVLAVVVVGAVGFAFNV